MAKPKKKSKVKKSRKKWHHVAIAAIRTNMKELSTEEVGPASEFPLNNIEVMCIMLQHVSTDKRKKRYVRNHLRELRIEAKTVPKEYRKQVRKHLAAAIRKAN